MSSDVWTRESASADLLRRWEERSLDTAWRRPSDWFTPAAEAVVDALIAGVDAGPCMLRLGFARAAAGIGITETIDDVTALYRVAGLDSPSLTVLRALCEGWTDGDAEQRLSPAVADAETGLATSAYLAARLSELYGAAARDGVPVPETYALVVVDVAHVRLDPWRRMSRNAAIGHALESAYGPGFPAARLSEGVYAVLVGRGPAMGEHLADLRDHIVAHASRMGVATLMRQPPRIWVEALPPAHGHAVELLEALQR